MSIKNYILEILVLAFILLLLVYSSDPVLYKDSSRYLKGSLNDPPLYSNIILVMQSIFKNLESVVVLQTILMGFAIIYLTKTLAITFNLDIFNKTIIILFLLPPCLKFYNILLTEPISYSFALLFVSFVIKLIYNFNLKNLVWSSFFALMLLLTRNQFVFLYPIIVILYLGIFMTDRSKKKFVLLIISFLSIFLISNSLTALNKFIKKNSLENKTVLDNDNGLYNFIYIDAIYISKIEDTKLFKGQNLQKTFAEIFNELNKKKALLKYYNGRGHFGTSYALIRNDANYYLKDLAIRENISIIKIKKEISIKLIKANLNKYIKHIFKKFYDSSWLFIFVPLFILLASSIGFLKYKSCLSLLMIFISSFSLANHSVIYFFSRVQPRYFIYSDFVLLIFIFIIFNIVVNRTDTK